ncbi:hypothetical protein RHMOL_Rhmol05G0201600 [Rhododendron molle]|uniref:Uncharacterized protein n=1 Tax=Rhododendron molle TaxID=49168 RepID=A0ACC0NRG2_RHOML|nr:hypothetical protein RHMOL_Rhmol05G0201600 [Rhododendron molle]
MEETRPLLVERRFDNADGSGHINGSSESSSTTITAVLLLATFVAIFGSIGSGCASGYSSAAESGIREDLGLTSAQGIRTRLSHAESSRESSVIAWFGLEDGAGTWRNAEQAAKTLLWTICRKLSLLKWSKTWNQCFNVLIIEFAMLPTVFQLNLSPFREVLSLGESPLKHQPRPRLCLSQSSVL